MRGLARFALAAALLGCVLWAGAHIFGNVSYSADPLKQKPLMSRAEVTVDLARFNNWLVENHASLPREKLPGPREHAFLLIDSVLKNREAEGRGDFNEFEIFTLKSMFNWGSKLGVFGSGLVAKHFAGGSGDELAPPLLPPDPFGCRSDIYNRINELRS